MELAVTVGTQRSWLVHGPDLDGEYGEFQGSGGVDAIIGESTGSATGVLSDIYGHTEATVSGATVNWNPVRSTGYGPAPGMASSPLDGLNDLSTYLAWHGKYIDGTGYYYLGTRYYDPSSGTFLSCDPLGNDASMSLYDYCGGDPVNGFDPDGRLGKRVGNFLMDGGLVGAPGLKDFGNRLETFGVATEMPTVAGLTGSLNGFMQTAAGIVTPRTYYDNAIADYKAGGGGYLGVTGVLDRYNPISMGLTAGFGFDAINGGRLGGWQRVQNGASAFLSFAALPEAGVKINSFASRFSAETHVPVLPPPLPVEPPPIPVQPPPLPIDPPPLPSSGLNVVPRKGMASRIVTDDAGNPVTVYGQAEASSSKTTGHAEAMNNLANRLVASGDYEYIMLQRSWRTQVIPPEPPSI